MGTVRVQLPHVQGTIRAGRRRFLEALIRDASVTLTLTIDPDSAPMGELVVEGRMAELVIEHGVDMLTHTDVHRSILRMPAPPQLEHALMSAAPPLGLHRAASSDSALSHSDDASIKLANDVCLHMAGSQQLHFDGGRLSAWQPKAAYHVQV
jgi:hypothetical protein